MTYRFFYLTLFTLFLNTFLSAQAFFTTSGKNIIGPNGQPFQLKGTNLGNWLVPEGYMFKFTDVNSPRLIDQLINELIGPDEAKMFWKKFLDVYITREDISYLKAIGMNSIRIPFNYRMFANELYMGASDSTRGFIYLDRLISWCRTENLPVILDMHCAPGGQTGDNIDDGYGYPFLFENEPSQLQCIKIWKRIAAHYKKERIIIGYDLLNEPIAHFFDKGKLNPLLEPFYKRVVAAIRQEDKNHIIFLGGAQWNSNFTCFDAPFDSKLVYTFHKYWTTPTQKEVQEYIDFGKKYNVPIYCGETGENEDVWIETFRKMLDSNNISWHFWPYKKAENTKGIVTFKTPVYYDSIIAYGSIPKKNFEDIRKNRPANIAFVKKALMEFLETSRFKNCVQNTGYIKALGFIPK